MVKGFILSGVLTTAIMFSGVSVYASALNTDSAIGMGGVNIQKTMENVCLGKLLKAESEEDKFLVYNIKRG